ncbi:MAG TPA: TraR/DksA family transcriptional regulator [Desulfomonilaceae bacterium]|nr:TraR/DksA family transcriptional regulator [Desulfomonilaceae bacterium]
MWMTREEIADALGIVPNSVRGKVQKGQIERKVEGGKNYYRVVGSEPEKIQPQTRTVSPPPAGRHMPEPERRPEPRAQEPQREPARETVQEVRRPPVQQGAFNPKQVLLDQLASLKIERNIDAIEKGDEIDLATGEISRELAAKISMRQHRQMKEIEDALERVKHGEYGICEDCGESIPEQRLRLFPAARLCVRCQEELDHYEKMKETQGLRGGAWREESNEGPYVKSFED